MADQSYIGKGSVYLGLSSGGQKRKIGNCSKLELSISEEKKELPDYENAGGGVANSISRVSGITAAITAHDISPENLALAAFGNTSVVSTTPVVDEAHTGYHDGLIRLAKLPDTATIVVTDGTGTTTYVADTDYTVNAAGVVILSTGSITDAQALLIDYTPKAGNLIQAVTNSGLEYVLTFVGLNEAQSGKAVVVDIHRMKFSPASGLGFIGDEFNGLELGGSVLKDASIVSAGLSQYFKVEMAA